MRAGISSATFFNKLFNEDVFDELRRMDCGVCEVFLTTYSEYGEEFAKLLASRKGDIEVHSVHTLNTQFEPELFNKNPRTFADAFALYEKVLARACSGRRTIPFTVLPDSKSGNISLISISSGSGRSFSAVGRRSSG